MWVTRIPGAQTANQIYPTVRNRLETVIQSLGYKPSKTTDFQEVADYRSAILSALEKGEITPQEALEQLKKLGR